MTEAEYWLLAEDYAVEHGLGDMKSVKPGVLKFECDRFFAAVKWTRENPPPEVQALIDESKNAEYWLRYAKYQTREAEHAACKVWTELCKCLASFKERTAGKGEG